MVDPPPHGEHPGDQATEADEALDDWVAALVARHGLGNEIPRCWREHEGLADELASLREAETVALSRGQLVPLAWFHQLRELVAWHGSRGPGRCAREDWHQPEIGVACWSMPPEEES